MRDVNICVRLGTRYVSLAWNTMYVKLEAKHCMLHTIARLSRRHHHKLCNSHAEAAHSTVSSQGVLEDAVAQGLLRRLLCWAAVYHRQRKCIGEYCMQLNKGRHKGPAWVACGYPYSASEYYKFMSDDRPCASVSHHLAFTSTRASNPWLEGKDRLLGSHALIDVIPSLLERLGCSPCFLGIAQPETNEMASSTRSAWQQKNLQSYLLPLWSVLERISRMKDAQVVDKLDVTLLEI